MEDLSLDLISDYFGVKIAFYFCWLGHYTTALVVPAVIGLLVWVKTRPIPAHMLTFFSSSQFFLSSQTEFLEDVGFVLFAFFNVVWATLYLESWKRRSAEISYRWGTADQRDPMLTEPRPLFKGEEKISEITGKPEPSYPDWKRNAFR